MYFSNLISRNNHRCNSHFNSNNKSITKSDEKEYQYDYEYDSNWEEVLKYTEEQREKYKNINCECG